MADAVASPLARRVYDVVNDAVSIGIKAAGVASNGVAHADACERSQTLDVWQSLEELMQEMCLASVDAMVEIRLCVAQLVTDMRNEHGKDQDKA